MFNTVKTVVSKLVKVLVLNAAKTLMSKTGKALVCNTVKTLTSNTVTVIVSYTVAVLVSHTWQSRCFIQWPGLVFIQRQTWCLIYDSPGVSHITVLVSHIMTVLVCLTVKTLVSNTVKVLLFTQWAPWYPWRAGTAQWLSDTRDGKFSRLWIPAGEHFSPGSTFCAESYFAIRLIPNITAVVRKRSQSFCQKCRWQVTTKHACTPCVPMPTCAYVASNDDTTVTGARFYDAPAMKQLNSAATTLVDIQNALCKELPSLIHSDIRLKRNWVCSEDYSCHCETLTAHLEMWQAPQQVFV